MWRCQKDEGLAAYHESMASIGYQLLGEYGIPSRRYFEKDSPSSWMDLVHLHAFQIGSDDIKKASGVTFEGIQM